MRIFLSFLLLFSLLFSKERGEIFFLFDTFIGNNAVSLKDIGSSWDGNYKTPKDKFKTIIFNDFKVGYKKDDISFGYFLKTEFVLKAHKDFANLLHTVKQKEDLEVGRVYDLTLSAKGFVTEGLEFGKRVYRYKNDDISYSINAFFSILNGKFVQDLKIDGFATATAKNSYEFLSRIDYFYSENYLYDLDVDKPKGLGYDTSFNFSLKYKKYSFFLEVDNILGYIYWENTPYSKVNLKSDNAVTDENGYTKYNPTVYGYEGKRSFGQRLEPKWNFSVGYDFDNFFLYLEDVYIQGVNIPSLKVIKNFDNYSISLQYENLFRTFTTSLYHHNFYIYLGSDNFNINNAKSLNIGGGIYYNF